MASIKTAIGQNLNVQKYEVSIRQWDQFYEDRRCRLRLMSKKPDVSKTIPATGINWIDVQEYLIWINANSNFEYNLPISSEWTAIALGVLSKKRKPIFTKPELRWASAYTSTPSSNRRLRARGSLKATTSGISDLNGHVWEWTWGCHSRPLKIVNTSRCPTIYVGGEHLVAIPIFARKPA